MNGSPIMVGCRGPIVGAPNTVGHYAGLWRRRARARMAKGTRPPFPLRASWPQGPKGLQKGLRGLRALGIGRLRSTGAPFP